MIVKLDGRFKQNLKGVFGKYEFEVGILDDKKYRQPMRGERGKKGQDVLTQFAGVPVRKASRQDTDISLSEISRQNRERYNYLKRPFVKKTPEIKRLIDDFFGLAFGRTEAKRLQNTLQAVVRNPILKKKYGSNAPLTKKIKGFDHVMMDTAQFFKAIVARVKIKGK